ncbi:MAG TPA: hypothetical protein VMP68_24525 [Candidatus Eisenbacteria bacterium]|nr:hypothetical protein [Candidatus Eisenbacteria bacterium]
MPRTLNRILIVSLFLSIAASAVAATPTLTSISPVTAYQNSPSLTLTANGANFVKGAVVYFGYGAPLTTTFVSSTLLTAIVPASDLTGTYSYSVYVQNPDGEQTSTLIFTVVEPTPSINFISPSSIVAGSTSTSITINGYNFMSTAKVMVNNFPVPTTFVNTQTLQITASKAELSTARIAQIAVSNPAPGGISSTLSFNVTYPVKVLALNLPAKDIIWDPYAQRIYASLPSSYGSHGNSIAVINPATGKIGAYHFAGSEPDQIAISADSKYLYVALDGNSTVQRFNLPSFTPDIVIPLSGGSGGMYTAYALAVDPADSHTIAVAQTSNECCFNVGIFFYKDSTQLPNYINQIIGSLVFGDGSTAYTYLNTNLTQIIVDSNGGTLGTQWYGLVNGSAIDYASGLIYSNGGQVFNPSTGLLVGTYDVGNSCCGNSTAQVLPDPAINRVFAVGVTPFFSDFGITTYDQAKFTPIAVADLSQFNGLPSPALQWGNDGLAFTVQPSCCNTQPQMILVQSPAMFAKGASNRTPATRSLSPASVAHGSGNLLVAVKGTNFVPGSQVTWNGISLFADYVSAKQLNLYVPSNLLASPGAADVIVFNPAPHGGTSASVHFTIN